MGDELSGTRSDAPRKMKFKPNVQARKAPKPEPKIETTQAEEDNNEWQKLVKEGSGRRGSKPERKSAPVHVAFGYGNTSTKPSVSRRFPTTFGTSQQDATASSNSLIVEKEYVEPWDYYSYYPVTLPLRRPYSGNPEVLDEEEFGEASTNYDHDEARTNPAAELGLLEETEEEKLLFFQLPSSLPLVKRSASSKGKEIIDSARTSHGPGISNDGCKLENLPAGFMGKLLVFKSGIVKMKLGDAVFDVSPGLDCVFAQEVAAINPTEKHCCILGELSKRATVIPDIDTLLSDVSEDRKSPF
ncbi:hypothetical protein H6P81_003862 [Aristolochia fimbriata]|uniref:RNA polymerase III RPC4 n=1 Tax=Aristolochia fimbriata TaxID=158543 RepID=A0AAV7FFU8_ARIFI|nr:hypothetical protein H6P81_003862 [Aristolochia fimbriata]